MNSPKRIYLDFNATAPVAPPVMEILKQEGWAYGNPSSVHALGKKARRLVNEVREFLFDCFGLSEEKFNLFFHSGATEGINTIIKGLALQCLKEQKSFSFYCLESDHSCVNNQQEFIELLGFSFKALPVSRNGELDVEAFEKIISTDSSDQKVLNWTWVNNETGVVNSLKQVCEIKKRFDLFVHVDGVQAPGKIEEWRVLAPELDSYTFSGHKFGALKGSGFSFIKENILLLPLLNGGGQQLGIRSGTENTWGIFSIKEALNYLILNYNFSEQSKAKSILENKIIELIGNRGEIIGIANPSRNGNTIDLLLYGIKAHTSAMVFDMDGIDLSNGSACSSGAVIASRVLLSMGYDEDQAKSALRISLSPYFSNVEEQGLWPNLKKVLERLLS